MVPEYMNTLTYDSTYTCSDVHIYLVSVFCGSVLFCIQGLSPLIISALNQG